jgi:hypothetical protein
MQLTKSRENDNETPFKLTVPDNLPNTRMNRVFKEMTQKTCSKKRSEPSRPSSLKAKPKSLEPQPGE